MGTTGSSDAFPTLAGRRSTKDPHEPRPHEHPRRLRERRARLDALAAALSGAKAARFVERTDVAGELHEIADLTARGLDCLRASTTTRAKNIAPAVADALDGMTGLATRIDASPDVAATSSTIDAIAGWAGLAAGTTIALR